MTIDLDVLLLAGAGAGLLVAGGALLRPAGRDKVRESSLERERDDAQDHASRLTKEKESLESELARLQGDASTLRAGIERAGFEATAEREQVEGKLTESQAEATRLAEELKAEQTLVLQMEASLDEVRGLLRTAQEELKTAKDAQTAAETRAQEAEKKKSVVPMPSPARTEPPRPPEAKTEIDGLKKSLATMTEERDAARNKAEAMERLVEGVRARSREMAKELSDLKAKHGEG